MLDGLPALTAHLEYQESLSRRSWSSIA
jgi:hypothetical protein